MFIDLAKIKIKAGDGGNGAISFHREKYVSAGGPDGGDGGKGGDVVFVVDTNLSTLVDFKYKRKYIAVNGDNGSKKNCKGKSADDLIIKVPRGTLIKNTETGQIMADMSGDEPQIIARGGKGGWGNSHFATPSRQIPRFAKPGLPGEAFEITLELKLLADVGLVGFPNVGKSTLISAVSAAKPKIANYHFTTLTPVLGVVRISAENSFVMADIPGLIEGASDGTGLGHAFLRHVDRCRLIVHVVDVSSIEGREPTEDFELINSELKKFSEELSKRPQIVVANKCDIASEEQIENFRKYITDKGYDFYTVSAVTTEGTKALINHIAEKLSTLEPIKEYEVDYVREKMSLKKATKEFTIKVEDGVYILEASWLVPVLGMVSLDDEESLSFMQRVLIETGVIAKLEEMGVKDGDTVSILNFEFDYVK